MASVPGVAVEFARMAVRAFYSVEFAVVVDGVLRNNNFCAHSTLVHVLRMKPKELRQILTRMVGARLMCCEKRQQKRINYKDEKKPARIVNTEFWYVPLVELLDAFQYRVDVITKEIDSRIKKESELDRYLCQRCKTKYKLVDICANFDPEVNGFICDAMGPSRSVCSGIVKEEDNQSILKETESFKKKFEDELRPLLELATKCSHMKIPAHPLEGADEETWALYVPETIGVHGEVVDEEGLTSDIAAEVNGRDLSADLGDSKLDAQAPLDAAGAEASGAIPERPDWFKESNKDAEDVDDDWEDERDGMVTKSHPSFGTGNSFGENNVDAQAYLQQMLGIEPAAVQEVGGEPDDIQVDVHQNDGSPLAGIVDEDVDVVGVSTEVGAAVTEDVMVSVEGEILPLSSITEDLIERMSPEEYENYYAVRQTMNGEDDDDDDVEFE